MTKTIDPNDWYPLSEIVAMKCLRGTWLRRPLKRSAIQALITSGKLKAKNVCHGSRFKLYVVSGKELIRYIETHL